MVKGFQTFVISSETIQATVTGQKALKNRLVRAMAAGTITFHFASGDKVITVAGGEDFAMDLDCTGITSTANVLMS